MLGFVAAANSVGSAPSSPTLGFRRFGDGQQGAEAQQRDVGDDRKCDGLSTISGSLGTSSSAGHISLPPNSMAKKYNTLPTKYVSKNVAKVPE